MIRSDKEAVAVQEVKEFEYAPDGDKALPLRCGTIMLG